MIRYPEDYNPILRYWERIESGKEIVSRKVYATYKHLADCVNNPGEYFYSPKRANHVIEFFENFCHHSKGKEGGKLVKLELWEKALLAATFGFIDINGNRQYREVMLIVGKKNGKSLLASGVALYMQIGDGEAGAEVYAVAPLALDTKVPTTSGMKTMGDIRVGDMVYKPNGMPTRVEYVSPVVEYPTYKVTFDDDSVVIATGNHPWAIEAYVSGGKNKPLKWVKKTVTTEEIRLEYGGRKAARIPTAQAYIGQDLDLPVKPYTLGAWLGDGRSNRGAMCGHYADTDVPERIMQDGYQLSYMTPQRNTTVYTVLGLRAQLRKAGLLDNKHIPEMYFFASVEQRKSLLMGLMDTDGTCTKTGECRYCGNNYKLVSGVNRLALSLGYKSHIHESKDQNGKAIWLVSFKATKDNTCFYMARKKERCLSDVDIAKCNYRYIKSIEKIETVPCRCIGVDDPEHLFVIGEELITTHNTKMDQAKIIWSESKHMVLKSPALRKKIKPLVNVLSSDTYNDGFFKPLASDKNTLDGLNVHCCLMDEIHQWRDGKALYDIMADGVTAREQPLVFITSTAGTIREDIYDLKYDEATRLINGYEDPNGYKDEHRLAFVYELDKRSEWTDPDCWKKANPGLGTIKNAETLAAKVERAKLNSALVKNLVCKEFNIRETSTEAWLTFDELNNTATFDLKELHPRYGIGGVDLSSTTDLTNATVIFQVPEDEHIYVLQMYFLPEDLLEKKVKEDQIPYDLWHEQGLLTLTPGNKVHYRFVTEWFQQVQNEYDIYMFKVGYDSWSATYFVEEMKGIFGESVMDPVIQGKKTLSAPMKSLGADLAKKRIIYNNNPILKWCITNTEVDIDKNNNIQPCKGRNATRRIDGLAGLLDAYVCYERYLDEYSTLI